MSKFVQYDKRNLNIIDKMKNMLTRTALVGSALLLSATLANAQTTVSGNLAINYKGVSSDKSDAVRKGYQFFGKEAQINIANKGKLSNGMEYAAGFSLELDGADVNNNNGTTANSALLQGATNENTYIDFIAGNTTVTFGADHIQNPDSSMANLVGIIDMDDAVSGVQGAAVDAVTSFVTTANSAYQAYGVGVIQTIPNIGKISVNYTPDRTNGLANGDTLSVNTTNNKATQYDIGNSAYEIGFVGDLGVKGLQVQTFMNRSDSGIAGFADLKGEMYGARYNFGQITVAAQRGVSKSAAAAPITIESDSFGVAYAVTPALSVGLSYGKTDKTLTTVDETIKQLSVGYNLGPVTVGASYAKVEDLGNTSAINGDSIVLQASTRF
jgi:hypothetical protein